MIENTIYDYWKSMTFYWRWFCKCRRSKPKVTRLNRGSQSRAAADRELKPNPSLPVAEPGKLPTPLSPSCLFSLRESDSSGAALQNPGSPAGGNSSNLKWFLLYLFQNNSLQPWFICLATQRKGGETITGVSASSSGLKLQAERLPESLQSGSDVMRPAGSHFQNFKSGKRKTEMNNAGLSKARTLHVLVFFVSLLFVWS